MADEKIQSSESGEAKGKAKADQPEPKFSIAQLIADAAGLLGCEPYEAAGGLYGLTADMTISDARSRVEKWLQTPVKEAS